jgi:hypothetical protein
MKVRRRYNSKSGDVYYTVGYSKVYHREDGPAVEWTDGTKEWYRNDILHREDGPAIEYTDGKTSWYKHGIRFLNKEAWFESLTEKEKEKEKMLYSEYFIRD